VLPAAVLAALLAAGDGGLVTDRGIAGAADPVPDASAEQPRAAPHIGDVRIVVEDVFDLDDPAEDRLAYRWINRLHRATRPAVIERQLLFASGDRYSPRLLEESERLLRRDRYLGNVEIRPVAAGAGTVDIDVVTRDVWTLDLGVGVGRAGGHGSSRVELEDANFLGSGKELALLHTVDVDRSTTTFRYRDPALLASRFQLAVGWADSDDGGHRTIDLARPFYSLDSRWSAGLHAVEDERTDSLYALGEVSDRFSHRRRQLELQAGLSRGLADGAVGRWRAGFTFRSDRFERLADSAAPPPAERTLAYPWIGYEWQRADWREARNLDRMGRTEDVPLGPRLDARLGLSSAWFGASRDELVFAGSAAAGFEATHGSVVLLDGALAGRAGRGGLAGTRIEGGVRCYRRDFGDHQLYASLRAAATRHLDPDEQLLLGGDNGLRGYPLRYQAGTAHALLTLEQRFFTSWYPLHLARVGWAVFYDAGRTWGGPPAQRLGLLQDLGVGLRLSPTRSGRAAVVHLDVAFPLDAAGDIDRVQWLIATRETF
jgi:outer membrane protein assembly factor BamA